VGRKKRKPAGRALDNNFGLAHTEIMLQLSSNSALAEEAAASGPKGSPGTPDPAPRLVPMVSLRRGEGGILDSIDLPAADARRLMELGFLPGTRVTAGLSAPGGDPRVFQVDGSEVALRRETARRLKVRLETAGKRVPRGRV